MSADVLLSSRVWRTTGEIAAARGLSRKKTKVALRVLESAGIVERARIGESPGETVWRVVAEVADMQPRVRVRSDER